MQWRSNRRSIISNCYKLYIVCFLFLCIQFYVINSHVYAQSTDNSNDINMEVESEKRGIRLLFFKTEACNSCEKAIEIINKLPKDVIIQGVEYPIEVDIRSILEDENTRYLQSLFEMYQVPDNDQEVPIVFIGNTYLSGDEQIAKELNELILQGEGMNADYEVVIKQQQTFRSWSSIASVFFTGILNGFNPCALSMTLLFLSLISVSKKHFLRYGISFLLGKFLAYLGVGIVISLLIVSIPKNIFHTTSLCINILLIIVCLGFSFANIMDFYHVRKGRLEKVKVQLPKKVRAWTEHVMKAGVGPGTSKILIIIIFLTSALIAMGEFLCAGQIYLASILQWVQKSPEKGVPIFIFLLYVMAMCIPSLVIIIIVQSGKSVFAVSEKAYKQLPSIKIIYSILFLIMAVISFRMLF